MLFYKVEGTITNYAPENEENRRALNCPSLCCPHKLGQFTSNSGGCIYSALRAAELVHSMPFSPAKQTSVLQV